MFMVLSDDIIKILADEISFEKVVKVLSLYNKSKKIKLS